MLKILLVNIIKMIRPILGPYGCCKYTISCTEFASMELKHNSFFKAIKNIIKRLLSCQPFL